MSQTPEKPKPTAQDTEPTDLAYVFNILRTRDQRFLDSVNAQTTEYLRVEIARLKTWMAEEIKRQVRDEAIGRVDVAIADHMSEEHPLGELHQLVDSAVMGRFEHYASIFERFHVAERAINHLVSTGAINESYSGRQASPDLDAIDAELEAMESSEEGRASA